MNNDFVGDFIGFTFNGQHSNYFNICHVSDGSRYNENLLPNLQDMTAQVPGGDGMYYWDSYYVQRQFNVQVAFDGIQETDWRNMRNWLGDRGIHELWFDEAPYKVYMAKIASPPQFKYICFKECTNNRTYKGEGTIVFTCYYPFAMSKNGKYLSDYSTYSNVSEWSAVSRMRATNSGIDNISDGSVTVYNAGDLPADWKSIVRLKNSDDAKTYTITNVGSFVLTPSKMDWSTIGTVSTSNDVTTITADFEINTRTELITTTMRDTDTVIACNKMLTAGDFFKIPVSTYSTATFTMTIPGAQSLEYDYLYL